VTAPALLILVRNRDVRTARETYTDFVHHHLETGDGDKECQDTANPHECFRISNMGNCELYLHATADDCEDGESEQFYAATEEDIDIRPDFDWNSWSVLC
jgi:hypothetical protein